MNSRRERGRERGKGERREGGDRERTWRGQGVGKKKRREGGDNKQDRGSIKADVVEG